MHQLEHWTFRLIPSITGRETIDPLKPSGMKGKTNEIDFRGLACDWYRTAKSEVV
jgi:hypothetical protein